MVEVSDDEISNEDNDDRRASVGSSQNSGPSSRARSQAGRMSMDKAAKKRENNKAYRDRQKVKMDTLIYENIQLVRKNDQLEGEIKGLKQEMQLLNLRLENQSKELGGLRKTCDKLEEKNAEEHDRNRHLESELKKREDKIESLNGKYVGLLEQLKVNPFSENPSNEMRPQSQMHIEENSSLESLQPMNIDSSLEGLLEYTAWLQ